MRLSSPKMKVGEDSASVFNYSWRCHLGDYCLLEEWGPCRGSRTVNNFYAFVCGGRHTLWQSETTLRSALKITPGSSRAISEARSTICKKNILPTVLSFYRFLLDIFDNVVTWKYTLNLGTYFSKKISVSLYKMSL